MTHPGSTRTAPEQGYMLPNDWEQADRRLELVERCHDAASIRRAEALGVSEGWRCLDAGAGGGSFARWLAGRVGESGSVVAADMDVQVLEARAAGGVEVVQLDLERDPLPPGGFDLVHTRLVLIHIAARERVLARLAAALRPGGVLLVEEDDVYPIISTASGAYAAAWQAFLGMVTAAGLDGEWARGLPERLDALGLVDVGAEVDVQLFRGGSPPAEFWSMTWLQARDRVAATGVPAHVIDEGRAALADPAQWFHGPAKTVAWGRRGDAGEKPASSPGDASR